MKAPRPQAIVALLLAVLLFTMLGGRILMIVLGKASSLEETEMWLGLMQFIVGGLLTWIGTSGKDKD